MNQIVRPPQIESTLDRQQGNERVICHKRNQPVRPSQMIFVCRSPQKRFICKAAPHKEAHSKHKDPYLGVATGNP
eukprot:8348918-Pyramimonas_sp.AAC.1